MGLQEAIDHAREVTTRENVCTSCREGHRQLADWLEELKSIREILGSYGLDRMRELVEADRDGRIKIYPKPNDNTCGACGNFHRIAGRRCGTCDVKSKYRDRYGKEDDRRGTFTPSQSMKACKQYVPKRGPLNGGRPC